MSKGTYTSAAVVASGNLSGQSQIVRHGDILVRMRLCFVALLLFDLCGRAQILPTVPDNLKPPSNETLALQAQAAGDQIYTCDGSSWVLSS